MKITSFVSTFLISGSVLSSMLFTVSASTAAAVPVRQVRFTPADLEAQYQRSAIYLVGNMTQAGVAPGVVVASPSRANPNYWYHWVRDAALTVDAALVLSTVKNVPPALLKTLNAFYPIHVAFIQKTMATPNLVLGEPRFNTNGSLNTDPWARPQNDGPALRAISMFDILSLAERERWPNLDALAATIYQPALPATSLAKADLEYVAHHWNNMNFDLWEESNGFHFYTLMAQRKALAMGSQWATRFKDPGASSFYMQQARMIDVELARFWDPSVNFIMATRQIGNSLRGRGAMAAASNLDSAVILGVLHSEVPGTSFSIMDERVQATFERIRAAFSDVYPVNKETEQIAGMGTAIGRYPEDQYDGYQTGSLGNPWVLATAGFGEYMYRLALGYMKQDISVSTVNLHFFTNSVRWTDAKVGMVLKRGTPEHQKVLSLMAQAGDGYLARVLFHKNGDGSLSEQINRNTGMMQGAAQLTWSHASIITAKTWRDILARGGMR